MRHTLVVHVGVSPFVEPELRRTPSIYSRQPHPLWRVVRGAKIASTRVLHHCGLRVLIHACHTNNERRYCVGQCSQVRQAHYYSLIQNSQASGFRIDIGGKLLTNHLKEIVSFRHWDVMEHTYVMNEVKEACCYVSNSFAEDLEACQCAYIPAERIWYLTDKYTGCILARIPSFRSTSFPTSAQIGEVISVKGQTQGPRIPVLFLRMGAEHLLRSHLLTIPFSI